MEPVTLTIAMTGSTRVTPVCSRPGEPSAPLLIDDEQHLPTGVYITAAGVLLTGRQAADHAGTDPVRAMPNPVALLGGPSVTVDGRSLDPVDLVAALISRCVAETHATTGHPPTALQLVVPAEWGPRRCTLLRTAAAHAGYGEPLLIAAPVAVACYATLTIGLAVPVGGLLAVCDTDTATCSVVTRVDDRDWDVLSTVARPIPTDGASTGDRTREPDRPTAAAHDVAGVVTAAIAGADVEASTLSAIACVGGPTLPPDLDAALADTLHTHPVLLARPTQAAALGAAHQLTYQPTAAAWAPIPAPDLGLRHVLSLAACGVLSLGLLIQVLSTAYINGNGIYVYYVLVNRGELALACLLAVLTCLGVGRALTLIGVAALAEHPAPPPGSRPQRLLAAGAGIGVAMCLIYGLTAATVLPLSVGDLLTPTLAAVAAPLLCTGWLLLILPRLYYLGGTALHQLGTPIAAIGAAATGTLLLQHGYTGALPHTRSLWEAHIGGALIGIGCALLFTHTVTSRLIAVPLVGAIGALAFTISTYQLATAAYLACTGIWWLARTLAITRDAYPRAGRAASPHMRH